MGQSCCFERARPSLHAGPHRWLVAPPFQSFRRASGYANGLTGAFSEARERNPPVIG